MGSVIPLKKSANSAYLELKNMLGVKLQKVENLIEQKLKSDVDLIKKMSEHHLKSGGKRLRALLTLEEHSIIGGLGGAVSEVLMQESVHPKKFKMMGLNSNFSTIVGSQSYLRKINNLDSESIVSVVKSLLNWKE